jgi:uncharacterized protein (DUF1800 family)
MKFQPTEPQPATPVKTSPDEPGTAAAIDVSDEALAANLNPIKKEAFGEKQARHLLWRAGFGGNTQQVRLVASWGPEKAVDYLLGFEEVKQKSEPASEFDKDIMRPPDKSERERYRAAQRAGDEDTLAELRKMRQDREQADRRQMAVIQRWWLQKMIETPRPFEEKMTLFWHGHFATNYRTIENSYHMFMQNEMFRKNAVGSFRDILKGIIRDPAMIAYLDNNDSRKGRPNENLAREIMELFSLGVGNYSEQDIKEGARALTGYTFEDDGFVFNERNHDTGVKRILGRSGPMDGDDFVEAILATRACSAFLARRLYHFFIADVPPDERGGDKSLDPAQRAVIRQLAAALRASNYKIKPAMRKLFLSEHFYEDRFVAQQIKSPATLVVGAVRSLNTPPRDLSVLNDAMDLMGQRLFFPPSVKGWDGGRSWINTSTLFVRQNVLAFLVSGKKPQGFDANADSQPYDPFSALESTNLSPDAAIENVLMVALGTTPSPAVKTLREYLESQNLRVDRETVSGMMLLATAMPEYQLC